MDLDNTKIYINFSATHVEEQITLSKITHIINIMIPISNTYKKILTMETLIICAKQILLTIKVETNMLTQE